MEKQIFIVNGHPGSGKDTFAEILGYYVDVKKYSIIDKIKTIAFIMGWNGSKEEKDRKFLSDLKKLAEQYNDLPFKDVKRNVDLFLLDKEKNVLLIDMREPKDIKRAQKEFGAKTVFIKNDRVKHIISNIADAGVENYEYDYIVENNGTLEDFKRNIWKFLCSL